MIIKKCSKVLIVFLLIEFIFSFNVNANGKNQNNRIGLVSFRGSYLMGFDADTQYSQTIYFEQARFSTKYEAKKGNTIDVAFSYNFSPSLGIELGGSITSRTAMWLLPCAVPHPLLFGSSRQASRISSYKLKETDLYLNIMYTFMIKSLAIDLFAGPCYVMAETTLLTGYTVGDVYPYIEVNFAYIFDVLKENVIGFNAGIAAEYSFGNTMGLVLSTRFISAKAKFETATDVPGVKYKIGGLMAGIGLKIKF